VLHGISSGTIQKLQWLQNNAADPSTKAITHQAAAGGAALVAGGEDQAIHTTCDKRLS